jgi:CRP/FNR family cyclic AMP-dependent transcriptional regulator
LLRSEAAPPTAGAAGALLDDVALGGAEFLMAGPRTIGGYNLQMGCDPEQLAGVKLFELLSDEDRAALAAVVDSIRLDAGQTLFEAGHPGESLFVVRSGEVELFISDNTGQKIVLMNAIEGDLFGELALLDRGARTATAVALADAELLELDREDLLLLFQRHPDSAVSMLAAVTGMMRKADELLRSRVSRNVNIEVEELLTPLQKVADWIAWFSGSMPFLMVNAVWFIIWIVINTINLGLPRFDPYPFGLLTMIVSLEAIFLSCFVLVSQNRQAEKDRVRSDIEYEINVKAELEVAHLHEKTDHLHEQMLARFAALEKEIRGLSGRAIAGGEAVTDR